MIRAVAQRLDQWLAHPQRRPLVLRGARQVGKTWLVRDLARRSGRELVELNFEKDPGLARHFATHDPRKILADLSLVLGRDILPDRCLLFLDEIQAAGHLLADLRWFYEEMPELPVVAAGSLLEFALADHDLSMPVGRVAFQHIEPLAFTEYLTAHGQDRLGATLHAWQPGQELSAAAHDTALTWWHRFLMVGGMPAVVVAEVAGESPRGLRDLQRELVATYRADFAKYQGRLDRDVLHQVFQAVVGSLGRKFVYAQVGEGVKQAQAKRGLDLLHLARVVQTVRYSAASGLPLGATAKDTFRKAVLVDIGLVHALVGTPAAQAFPAWTSLGPALRGQLMDQFAGQELRQGDTGAGDGPELFYWQRDGGRPGEIDYLLQTGGRIIPVELKSGATGAMKSLHQFMADKGLELAVRCDTNPPSLMNINVKTTQGDQVAYRMLSLPPYLLGRAEAILAGV